MLTRRRALALAAAMPAASAHAGSGEAQPEPGPVLRFYTRCRYGQLHGRGSGSGNASPLIAFHQVPNSSQVFEAFLPLIGRDRRAMALDTPGYGMSDPAPDPQSILDYAEAMVDAHRAMDLPPADLLGYHTGAAIALAFAARHPERVRRLLLVAVPVFSAAERESFGALPPIPFDEAGDWARTEWQRTIRWRGPDQSLVSLKRGFAEKLRPGARERGATAIAAFDTGAALAASRHPLMIVRPRDDLWEATGRAMALRPDAPALALPDYGHGLFDVIPARMAAIARDFFA
jgi:pimeloyl-ACP methyl ester carboxylesterase